jgi:hypothetical protein
MWSYQCPSLWTCYENHWEFGFVIISYKAWPWGPTSNPKIGSSITNYNFIGLQGVDTYIEQTIFFGSPNTVFSILFDVSVRTFSPRSSGTYLTPTLTVYCSNSTSITTAARYYN